MAERARSGGFLGSMRRWLGTRRDAARVPALSEARSPPLVQSDRRVELMLAEWQDIRESLRSCAHQRLAQLGMFLIVSTAIIAGYLPIATASEPRWIVARSALPVLGILVSAVFLALEVGSLVRLSAWARRGCQIETALQVLLPGIGHVSPIALLSQFDPGTEAPVRIATGAVGALYGLMLLAWAAALVIDAALH